MRVERGDGWELRLGDSMDAEAGMATVPVDHTIEDPPYTQRTSEGARTPTRRQRGGGGRYIGFDGIDGLEPVVMAAALSCTRRWVVIFCAIEQVGRYSDAAGDAWIRGGIWHKPDAMPQLTGDRPAMWGESIAIAHNPGAKRWNRRGRPAFWRCNKENHRVGHPTQKPLSLLESIIRDFTDPGELICDGFAGSGTTGVAAVRLGRRFIGWEHDDAFFEMAVARLRAVKPQGDLFEATVGNGKQEKMVW